MSSAAGALTGAHQQTWFGHPRGLFLVASTELWERFSYWGMAGLLVLYLTTPAALGGWDWHAAAAVRFYGWYGGLAFILPVVGAWLANNYLGERRCILWGGVAITAGHVLLAGPVAVPMLLAATAGVDVDAALRECHVPLGRMFPDGAMRDELRACAESRAGASYPVLLLAYWLKSWSFLSGLLLIVAGTGLMKPTISSIVSHLYPEGGARRDEGFSYFFLAIYVGAMLGSLVAGFLGERIGWHYGFTAAAVGMAFGLSCYLALQRQWLGDLGAKPARRSELVPPHPLTTQERDRLVVIVVQGLFTLLYAAGFYQMGGLLKLYAFHELDRTLFGFLIPAQWLQTVNLWTFFVAVPLLARLWRGMARRNRNPSASYKLAMGLAALAVGYMFLLLAEATRRDSNPSFLWLVGTYLCFGVGDALVWANQISLTSKLAPARWAGVLVGGWYVWIGLGIWLAGYLGGLATAHPRGVSFLWLATGSLGAAVVLACLTPALRQYMHNAERLDARETPA